MRPFTDQQIELATTFADQAVIAIENVRLFDDVQNRTRELSESLDQQRASGEVLAAISSSIADTKPVFDVILASCQRLFVGPQRRRHARARRRHARRRRVRGPGSRAS